MLVVLIIIIKIDRPKGRPPTHPTLVVVVVVVDVVDVVVVVIVVVAVVTATSHDSFSRSFQIVGRLKQRNMHLEFFI